MISFYEIFIKLYGKISNYHKKLGWFLLLTLYGNEHIVNYGTNAGTNSKRGGNSETEKDLDDHHRNGIYCSISRGRQLC